MLGNQSPSPAEEGSSPACREARRLLLVHVGCGGASGSCLPSQVGSLGAVLRHLLAAESLFCIRPCVFPLDFFLLVTSLVF